MADEVPSPAPVPVPVVPAQVVPTPQTPVSPTVVPPEPVPPSPVPTVVRKEEKVPDDEPAIDIDEPEPFDFSKWDGDVEHLPEHIKGHTEPLAKFYAEKTGKEKERLENKVAELETIYRALADGQEDPRIAQSKTERDRAVDAFETFKREQEQRDEMWARTSWDKFKRDHPQYAKSEKSKKVISDLLGENWSLDEIPQLLEMPNQTLAAVREEVKGGLPRHKALELVQLRSERDALKSKPTTAHLVSGAENQSGNPAEMTRGPIRKQTYDERRSDAIQRAMKKLK